MKKYWIIALIALIQFSLLGNLAMSTAKKYFWRYEITYFNTFYDYINDVVTEPEYFSYKVCYPYIYIFGVTGYTRLSLNPVKTEVIKIENRFYDNALEPDENIAPKVHTRIKKIKKTYGNQYYSKKFEDLNSKDIKIFKELTALGKEEFDYFVDYYSVKEYPFSYDMERTRNIIEGVDSLRNQLNDIEP